MSLQHFEQTAIVSDQHVANGGALVADAGKSGAE